jgi:hypothetical protein
MPLLALNSQAAGPRLTGLPLVAFAAALIERRSSTTLRSRLKHSWRQISTPQLLGEVQWYRQGQQVIHWPDHALVIFGALQTPNASRVYTMHLLALSSQTAGPRLTARPLVAFVATLVERRASTTLLPDASLGTELASSGTTTRRTTSGRVRCHVGRAAIQHHSSPRCLSWH